MALLAGSAPPQWKQLHDLLADGRWHTTRELLFRVPCIVHSRIAELRSKGFVVEHETTGKGAAGSRYRLINSLDAGEAAASQSYGATSPASSESPAPARSLLASGMQPSAPPPETPDAKPSFEQLRIEAA